MNIGENPKITVATVVFNGELNIVDTIESVLSQDYSRVEYVIIDGGSNDGTLRLIGEYVDRVDIFLSEADHGIFDAMNKAIRLSSGDLILFMNCGDVFASSDALSLVVPCLEAEKEQVLFGAWIRRENENCEKLCRPDIRRGLFNHQAVLYSRSIHSWNGLYLNIKGFTTADYLFFCSLIQSRSVKWKIVETTLAVIEVKGISSGMQTLSQKCAIDYIFGRISKFSLLSIIILHPVYRIIKKVITWRL